MKPFHWFKMTFVLLLIAMLAACGGSSGNNSTTPDATDNDDNTTTPSTVSGTAATGVPMTGFVYLRGNNGVEVSTPIGAGGTYSIDVSNLPAPYMLKAVADALAQVEYSFAEAAGIANITPLTTLALYESLGNQNLANYYESWATYATTVNAEQIEAAAQQILAEFESQINAAGINPESFDLFSTAFDANHTGFDAVLDQISVVIDFATGVVTVNGENFDIDIDPVDNPDLPTGDWTLVISGTVNNMGMTIPIDNVTVQNVPAPTEANVSETFEQSYGNVVTDFDMEMLEQSDTRVVFRLTGSSTTQGMTVTYDLLYTYTR